MSSNPSSTTTARTAHESTAGRGRAGQAAALTAGPALLLVGMVLMLSPHLWLPSHLVFLAFAFPTS